ncbi:MAG: PTS system nitrogen regulatory IIA component [Hyphomonadaceae bacterium]|nr:MAG: PTS system nitrogen regulatory IIA component [Hyphomonadaceae bacterium]
MPNLGELLRPNSVIYRVKGVGRKEVLANLAKLAADAFGADQSLVYENALAREALGGTGVGDGVAVPHARIKDLEKSCGVLVFLLLSPEDSGADHLKALAKITRALRQPNLRASLRAARSSEALLAVLTAVEREEVA